MTNLSQQYSHPKLRKPPLVEVVFQIDFLAEKKLEAYKEALIRDFSAKYPVLEPLNFQRIIFNGNLENSVEVSSNFPPEVVQIRLLDQPKPNVMQIVQFGDQVMSVNAVITPSSDGYGGFENFIEHQVQDALNFFTSHLESMKFTRLTLKYINHIPYNDVQTQEEFNQEKFNQESYQFPLDSFGGKLINNLNSSSFYFPDGTLNILIAYPQINQNQKQVAIVDIEHIFTPVEAMFIPMESILKWCETAHEKIYGVFSSVLNPAFLKGLE
jgi:uncharacterized protein (TIGR04255 family)